MYALLGADHDSSPYTQAGERIARIAAGGIRLIIDELRTDVTRPARTAAAAACATTTATTATRRPRSPGCGGSWTERRPAGELYGRALVVSAAEQHASPLVVPSSQRMSATRWSSHKDIAAKAIKRLAGPHVPATLSELERAIKRAHATYDKAETQAREQQRAGRHPVDVERDNDQPVGDEFTSDLDQP